MNGSETIPFDLHSNVTQEALKTCPPISNITIRHSLSRLNPINTIEISSNSHRLLSLVCSTYVQSQIMEKTYFDYQFF